MMDTIMKDITSPITKLTIFMLLGNGVISIYIAKLQKIIIDKSGIIYLFCIMTYLINSARGISSNVKSW